jgi:putative Holliday junction resolvase
MNRSIHHSPDILALDVGRKRVGIAIYSEDKGIITPLESVERAGKRAEQAVLRLAENQNLSLIVIGFPLSADNEKSEQGEDVTLFADRLRRRCLVPIELRDEYLSSEEAKELLGISGSPHRIVRESGIIDAVAACLILQRHLLAKGHSPPIELGTARREVAALLRSGRASR